MKGKVWRFISFFALYCVIFLVWNGFDLTSKQIAETVFIGTIGGVGYLLMVKPMTRLTESVLRKLGMTRQKS